MALEVAVEVGSGLVPPPFVAPVVAQRTLHTHTHTHTHLTRSLQLGNQGSQVGGLLVRRAEVLERLCVCRPGLGERLVAAVEFGEGGGEPAPSDKRQASTGGKPQAASLEKQASSPEEQASSLKP